VSWPCRRWSGFLRVCMGRGRQSKLGGQKRLQAQALKVSEGVPWRATLRVRLAPWKREVTGTVWRGALALVWWMHNENCVLSSCGVKLRPCLGQWHWLSKRRCGKVDRTLLGQVSGAFYSVWRG
jgi:hypothetical protein